MEDLCRLNMTKTSCLVFFLFGVDVSNDLFASVHFPYYNMGFLI
jgi:hypothetical protein